MATTSVSSTSTTANTTAAQNAAAKKAAAQSLISSLGAGSGVDVAALAQNLVDAEGGPKKANIQDKITKNENRISGYSAVMFMLGEMNTALAALKDKNDFNAVAVSGGSSSAFSLSTTESAKLGDYAVQVHSTYKAQKSMSDAYSSATASINNGQAFQLNVSLGGVAQTPIDIAAADATPQGVVNAINSNTALGIKAELVNTGTTAAPAYKMVLTGQMGADKNFEVSATNVAGFGFGTTLQSATNAEVTVNGVRYQRSSNAITDIISGTTLNLKGVSSGSETTTLSRDTTALKAKFETFVTAYNDAQSLIKEVTNPKSELETYGASLVGDATVRMVGRRVRDVFSGDSSTAGTNVKQLWQMGISFDATGVMALDSSKLDTALTNNFDDVVKSLTGNHNDLSKYSPAAAGFFGDASYKITNLISPTGILATQSTSATTQNASYETSMTKLDERMQSLLARYNKQFSSMQSLVGSANAQKTSLKSTFDGMMSIYTNNN